MLAYYCECLCIKLFGLRRIMTKNLHPFQLNIPNRLMDCLNDNGKRSMGDVYRNINPYCGFMGMFTKSIVLYFYLDVVLRKSLM